MLSTSAGHTSPKRWLLPTNLHGDLTQKNIVSTAKIVPLDLDNHESRKYIKISDYATENNAFLHLFATHKMQSLHISMYRTLKQCFQPAICVSQTSHASHLLEFGLTTPRFSLELIMSHLLPLIAHILILLQFLQVIFHILKFLCHCR
jgi:hypothetical protein